MAIMREEKFDSNKHNCSICVEERIQEKKRKQSEGWKRDKNRKWIEPKNNNGVEK